ncbi:DUF3397 family protein [Lactobacillus kalixensis]|nr:DUF3397 family protein [Lactobacillus kalixensis]
MFLIILLPVIGILVALVVDRVFPKAQFRGSDFLPFFFLPACNMITNQKGWPSFLPYGFFTFFILVVLLTIRISVKEKNISLLKTVYELWGYLSLCSVFWFIGSLAILVM